MVRVCLINNCKSKSVVSKKKDSENCRQFFQVPKNEVNRNKWLDAIKPYIRGKDKILSRKNLFLCDLHFEPDCFCTGPFTRLIDGVDTVFERKRTALKKSSIPSIFKVEKPELSLTNNEESCFESCDIKIDPLKKSKEKRELSPASRKKIDVIKNVMSLLDRKPISDEEDLSRTTINQEYTLDALRNDWNSRDCEIFPKFWSMIDFSDSLLFAYAGDESGSITRSIFVKNDMSVQLKAHNNLAQFPVVTKIISFENLRSEIVKITCFDICERASNGLCKKGFFIRKAYSSSKKCDECQIKCRRESKSKTLREKRLLNKRERQKKNMRNLKQKYILSLKKVEALRSRVEQLMERCANTNDRRLLLNIKNRALGSNINYLPENKKISG